MKKLKAMDKRVDVDLPISVSLDDNLVKSNGRVNDISINGMKLSLPLPFGMIEEETINFNLDLPNPFSKIKGRGRVQWKKWDQQNNCIQCGLKLEPMTLKQLEDLDAIVNELSD